MDTRTVSRLVERTAVGESSPGSREAGVRAAKAFISLKVSSALIYLYPPAGGEGNLNGSG